MKKKKGRLVVIDGLDGSGKKTQLDLLVKYCEANKINFATVDFPQYYKTFFGQLVGRYLKGEFGNLDQTNPYLAALTFAGDRWQVKPAIKKALRAGRLVLANRYTSSSMTFMAGKFKNKSEQDEFVRWIMKLEQGVYGCPKEDLLIYLSVPPAIGQSLVLQKGKRKYVGNKNQHDIHEQNLAYLIRVREIYLRLVKRFPHWVKIECLDQKGNLKTREKIHQEILPVLKSRRIIT